MKERTSLCGKTESFKSLSNDMEENEILLEMALEESDDEAREEVCGKLEEIDERINKLSLDLMLSGKDEQIGRASCRERV